MIMYYVLSFFIFLLGLFPSLSFGSTCSSTIFDIGSLSTGRPLIFSGTGSDHQRQLEQSFQIATTTVICGVTVGLHKEGLPTNNVLIGLKSSEGGANLGQGSLNGASVGSTGALYFFPLDSPVTVLANTTYWINASVDSNRSETNRYDMETQDIFGTYYLSYTNDDVSWISDSPYDFSGFKLWYSTDVATSSSSCYGNCIMSTSTDFIIAGFFSFGTLFLIFVMFMIVVIITMWFLGTKTKKL